MMNRTPYVLGLSCFLCTGCEVIAEHPYLSQLVPTIAFDGLQVNQVSFEEVDTEFLFAIDNPNPVGIDIEDFSYSLAFADIDWMDGDNPDGLLLGASGLSQVSLPTHIVFSELYDVVQAIRGLDHVPFGLSGDFGLRLDSSTLVTENSESTESDADAEVMYLPYDADGDFPALRRPKINLQKLKVRNLSWSEINLDLIMNVDNDHASNLIFQRFSYDLTLGGNSVVTGLVDDLAETIHGEEVTDQQRNRRLSIPITIDSSLVGSLWDLLQNGRNLEVDFAAVTDVDTPFGLMELQIDETGNVDVEVQ